MLKDDWNRAEADIVVARLFEQNPDKVQQARERPQLIGWFVGQAMKRLILPAEPKLVNDIVRARLSVPNGHQGGEAK